MAKKKLKRKNPCTACAATTLAGNPCKGKPVGRSKYCMSHSKKRKAKKNPCGKKHKPKKKNPCGKKHKPKKKNPCGKKHKPKKKNPCGKKHKPRKKKMRRKLRKNPGFSFKDGKAIKHDAEHDELYARIPPRRNPTPWASHMDAPPEPLDGPATSLSTDMTEHFLGPMRKRSNPLGMCPSCMGTGFRRNPGVHDSYGYNKPPRRFRVRRRRYNPYRY